MEQKKIEVERLDLPFMEEKLEATQDANTFTHIDVLHVKQWLLHLILNFNLK